MKLLNILTGGVAAIALTASAHATTFTMTSPTSYGLVPSGVSEIGGIVVDMVGTNGNRVVAQRAASGLFTGQSGPGNNLFLIGTQTGLNAGIMSQLGGGISQLAVRITLQDGDTASGNFDFNDNTLQLNNIPFQNFSSVTTRSTNSTGTTDTSGNNFGFRNNALDTGWFFSNSAPLLASIYNSILISSQINYQLFDVDPNDNLYDFSAGISSSLLNVELPPAPPTSSVPDGGSTVALLGLALSAAAGLRRRFSV